MPIDMAPPSSNIQGYQIAPPQSVDPLQTLAQMGQLRQQAVQTQNAQMQMQSARGLMAAYHDAGGDIDKMAEIAPQYGVMPDEILKVKQTLQGLAKDRAQTLQAQSEAAKNQLAATDAKHDALNAAYQDVYGIKDPDDQYAELQSTNQALVNQGWDPKDLLQATGPGDVAQVMMHGKHAYTTSNWIKAEAERQAQEAAAKASGATTAKTNLEAAAADKAQVVQEIQAAPTDPNTGSITPAALAAVRARHPNVPIPYLSTQQAQDAFIRSAVPVEKQPEYDLNQMKAKAGILGNSEFDQYIAKYAAGIKDAAHPNGMLPTELSPPQFREGFKQFKADSPAIDPQLLALMLGTKQAELKTAQAGAASIPTDQELDRMAQDVYSGAMGPDQLNQFKTRSLNYAPQVYERVQKLAQADGVPFDWATAEQRYRTRQNTETKFATGPEAQMVRSFGNLMDHLQLLDQARQALSQHKYPALQSLANTIGIAAGSDAPTTYDLIADYVSSEASKAMLPGGGGEAERTQTRKNLSRDLGDVQLAKNIRALAPLVNAQKENLERQYSEGTFGRGSRIGNLFSPQSIASVNQLMGKKPAAPAGGAAGAGATAKVPPPTGTTRQFKDGTTRAFSGKLPASDMNNWTVVKVK